jgi:hypothetical protein
MNKPIQSKPQPNLNLLLAIKNQGFTQKDFGAIVGAHPSFISRVVNGWVNLDYRTKIRYAKAVNRKVEEVF